MSNESAPKQSDYVVTIRGIEIRVNSLEALDALLTKYCYDEAALVRGEAFKAAPEPEPAKVIPFKAPAPPTHKLCRKKCGHRSPILPTGGSSTLCERCAPADMLQHWKKLERLHGRPLIFWKPPAEPEKTNRDTKVESVNKRIDAKLKTTVTFKAPPRAVTPTIETSPVPPPPVVQPKPPKPPKPPAEPEEAPWQFVATTEMIPNVEGMSLADKQLVWVEAAKHGSTEAVNLLLESIHRLMLTEAQRYLYATKRGNFSPADVDDAVAEMRLSVLRKFHVFDAERGNGFVTWAMWWIKQAKRTIRDNITVRLPEHINVTKTKLYFIRKRLASELGREPTEQEVSDAIELSPARIRKLDGIRSETSSLDAPLSTDSETTRLSLMPSDEPDPMAVLADKDSSERVAKLLSCLNDRERFIIQRRYGIGDDNDMTLDEIGKELGITRERVRQIEIKAVKKLRFRASKMVARNPA